MEIILFVVISATILYGLYLSFGPYLVGRVDGETAYKYRKNVRGVAEDPRKTSHYENTYSRFSATVYDFAFDKGVAKQKLAEDRRANSE